MLPTSGPYSFPALTQKENFNYLDSAATALKPKIVIDAIHHYYNDLSTNVHRALHPKSVEATALYEETRLAVQKFIHAKEKEEVIFTKGTTEGINLLARSLGELCLKPGDEILLTEMEHHSNIVPWQLAAKRTGAVIKVIPIDEETELDLSALPQLITSKTKIISLSAMSNVLSTITLLDKIIPLIRSLTKAYIVIDAAQAISKMPMDVQALDADFLVFSAHKLYGPTGVGILWGKRNILEEMPPFLGGGDMINQVSFEETTFNDLPYKFEAGTPAIASVIGLTAALNFVEYVGIKNLQEHSITITQYAKQQLLQIPDLEFICPSKNISGCTPFIMKSIHCHDLGTLLGKWGVAIRTGHLCAQPLLKKLGHSFVARASYGAYTTKENIDQLVHYLNRALELY
jgi:cysteine desulfurase/selenocysteine lyase